MTHTTIAGYHRYNFSELPNGERFVFSTEYPDNGIYVKDGAGQSHYESIATKFDLKKDYVVYVKVSESTPAVAKTERVEFTELYVGDRFSFSTMYKPAFVKSGEHEYVSENPAYPGACAIDPQSVLMVIPLPALPPVVAPAYMVPVDATYQRLRFRELAVGDRFELSSAAFQNMRYTKVDNQRFVEYGVEGTPTLTHGELVCFAWRVDPALPVASPAPAPTPVEQWYFTEHEEDGRTLYAIVEADGTTVCNPSPMSLAQARMICSAPATAALLARLQPAPEPEPDHRLFVCYWAAPNASVALHDFDFFHDDNGYDDDDRAAIDELEVSNVADIGTHPGTHLITRVA